MDFKFSQRSYGGNLPQGAAVLIVRRCLKERRLPLSDADSEQPPSAFILRQEGRFGAKFAAHPTKEAIFFTLELSRVTLMLWTKTTSSTSQSSASSDSFRLSTSAM